jgi:hypothetical protein
MNDWQNQDKVTNNLRDKVYNHSEIPSLALWSKVEARLDGLAGTKQKKRFPWYWMAVITVGVIAGLWAAINFVDGTAGVSYKFEITTASPKTESPITKLTPVPLQKLPAKANEQILDRALKNIKNDRRVKNKNSTFSAAEKINTPVPDREDLMIGSMEEIEKAVTKLATTEKERITTELSESISTYGLPIGEPILINFHKVKFPDLPLYGNTKLIPLPVEKDRWVTPVSVFSIAIANNISYGITRYTTGTKANAARLDNAKLTNEISNGRAAPSFGISGGLRITNRLMLSLGFRRTIYSDKYTYDIKKAAFDPYRGADPTLLAFNYKHGGDSIIPGSTYSFVNKFYSSEVPVIFSYYVPMSKRWNVVLDAGFSFMRVNYASAAYLDIDRVGFVVVQSLSEYPGFKMVTNLNIGMGLSYRLNGKFSAEATPYFRYGLNSMIKDKSFTQQSPAFFGLNFTLRYHAF